MAKSIDWTTIEEANDKYVVRTFYSQGEYHCIPVESTDGDYLVMPDGTRLLDFFNQLYCVNVGQKNPRVTERIKEARTATASSGISTRPTTRRRSPS